MLRATATRSALPRTDPTLHALSDVPGRQEWPGSSLFYPLRSPRSRRLTDCVVRRESCGALGR
eukprot:scaffold37491_cov30-Tisochrysis_lutea.AAC.2